MGTQTLSIGFLGEAAGLPADAVVAVPEFIRVLEAFQRAVYVTAAYDLKLPSLKNLSDDQRQRHTLGITGYRQGSFWTDLLPLALFTVASATQLPLFPHELMQGLLASSIWETIRHTIDGMSHQFRGQPQDDSLSKALLPSDVAIAKEAIRHNQTIEII